MKTISKISLLVALFGSYYIDSLALIADVPSKLMGGTATASTDTKAEQFKANSRKLWTEHMVWDHEYLIAVNERDANKLKAIDKRLMKNQDDIGSALAPYYGKEAGQQLATLLKKHIKIGGEVAKATKAHNTTARDKNLKLWRANGNDIAEFVHKINNSIDKTTFKGHWDMHLDLADKDLDAQMKGAWSRYIDIVDQSLEMGLTMADMLSQATIIKFKDKF